MLACTNPGSPVARTTRFLCGGASTLHHNNCGFFHPLYKTKFSFRMRPAERASYKFSLKVIPELWVLNKKLASCYPHDA
jgi:hypothetical protein